MNENKIKVGSVVELNSGGPYMTVSSIDAKDGTFKCRWFNKNELDFNYFKAEELKIINNKKR